MFGFFESFNRNRQRAAFQAAHDHPVKCEVLYREPLHGGPGVFVEIRGEGEHLVYVANHGITPAYLNTPYEQWCRETLLESYVFATLDSALDYFQKRHGGIKPDLISAIRGQTAA
jgi:hypothetical protein